MEERIIEKDELRKVRITRKNGKEDVIDDALPADMPPADGAEDAQTPLSEEEEYSVEFEGEEYDEDLVGLTPTQYRAEIERRERAAREAREACEKLCAAGEERLAAEDWAAAEGLFGQALTHEENARAEEGLWAARTRGFTAEDVLYTEEGAQSFARAGEEAREKVFSAFGEKLRAAQKEAFAEAEPLKKQVEAGQAERRGPFRANRNYYLLRLGIAFGVFVLLLIGTGVSASYLLRIQSALPVALTGAFGALAFAALVVTVVYVRKTLVAVRLCRENEKLSSTEEGMRLAELQRRLACLAAVFGEDGEAADGAAEQAEQAPQAAERDGGEE